MGIINPNLFINSGGQTGADRAGLDWAIDHGLRHGGFCPKGRRSEDGKIPNKYQLTEIDSHYYTTRTELNVKSSDATIIFTLESFLEGGSKQTAQFAENSGKPWLHVHPHMNIEALKTFIEFYECDRINIAGRRESKAPGIYWFTYNSLNTLLR